jgi:5-methylcytosine-specific restriction endonuclease McrA
MPDHTTPHPYSRKKIPAPFRARYGRWTVLCDAEVGKKWICLCDCGNIRAVDAYSVRKGTSVSCGCFKNEQAGKRQAKDIAGQRFGRLVAVHPTERRGADQSVFWLCRCDCGNTKEISTTYLNNGTRSCGCLYAENNLIDLRGQRFGRLVVIERDRSGLYPGWRCKCDCGNETVVATTNLRKGLTRSCRCLSAELSAARNTGPNHWNWKGGVVPWNQRDRTKPQYAAWREAVLLRDGRACQVCGDASGVLAVHHLESYATNLDLRLSVDNGITLCKDCHWDFHAKYGKRDNTKQQFVEYLDLLLRVRL